MYCIQPNHLASKQILQALEERQQGIQLKKCNDFQPYWNQDVKQHNNNWFSQKECFCRSSCTGRSVKK